MELCSALDLGGLTPGPGLIAAAARASCQCLAMIRPRGGDFVFDESHVGICLDDIAAVRSEGLAGVVIGASLPDGTLDSDALARMVEAAGPLDVTLHRAFDLVPDAGAALETAAALGIRRILTSGQAASAPQGIETIRRLVEQARGRIEIMAGGGVTPEAAPLLLASGVDALHASCGRAVPARQQATQRIGIDGTQRETDAAAITALRHAMRRAEAA